MVGSSVGHYLSGAIPERPFWTIRTTPPASFSHRKLYFSFRAYIIVCNSIHVCTSFIYASSTRTRALHTDATPCSSYYTSRTFPVSGAQRSSRTANGQRLRGFLCIKCCSWCFRCRTSFYSYSHLIPPVFPFCRVRNKGKRGLTFGCLASNCQS